MRKTREILRLKWLERRSHREAARSLGVSAGVVGETLRRAKLAALDWAQVEALSETALEARLYPSEAADRDRPLPNCEWIHTERRRPGVTLALLHLEYLERHPNGYRYTQFCEAYRRWLAGRRLTMRQVHRAGEKLFVDYAGQKPHLTDPHTGELRDVELFVAALGASNYTYAEATLSQKLPDWIGSHVRAFAFLGGVPTALVPDQLKSGVTQPCRYEPGPQRTYAEMARHYGAVILPARPAAPRDKAKVEVAVQVAERWILARLRNQVFFTLPEINERIAELNDDLNARKMRLYGASRRELFDQLDRPALKPLPAERFVYGEWSFARVHLDYHIQVEHHFYSVPFRLFRERVEARLTATTLEVFHGGERVASHPRSFARGRHTTDPNHMPVAHREHLEWSPARFIHWAAALGPNIRTLVEAILADRPHPEMGYRACLGILQMKHRYGPERLDAACARALHIRARSSRSVASILKAGLDRQPLPEPASTPASLPLFHENVRGGDYYNDPSEKPPC